MDTLDNSRSEQREWIKLLLLPICFVILISFSSCLGENLSPVVLSPDYQYISTSDGTELIALSKNKFTFPILLRQDFIIKNGNYVYGVGDREPMCMIREKNGYLILYHYFDKNQSALAGKKTYIINKPQSFSTSSSIEPSSSGPSNSALLEVLKIIYPSSSNVPENTDTYSSFRRFKTDRFYWYERIESPFDVLWQTQDGYSYVDNPNPVFRPYPGIENAYVVEWNQSDNKERTKVGLVFVKQDGLWLIDNAWPIDGDTNSSPEMYFDYSRAPEHWVSDDAMDEEERAYVRKVKKMLAQQ